MITYVYKFRQLEDVLSLNNAVVVPKNYQPINIF
jgi:hypothetical protein